jgi:hypothetical protein
MADIIKSYLVSLSAGVDKASFDKFQSALGGAEKSVQSSMGSIVGNLLKFEVAGISAFATVGFGIIGYIDKLAMADAAMRRNAQMNMMSIQQYRGLQNTLSALDLDLNNIWRWTPEDFRRFHDMSDHMAQLETMLGGNKYEDQMMQMRRIHDQITMLEYDAQYFGMRLMSDLLGKMGFGNDGLLNQLERLNQFVMLNMPQWSDELSTDIIPVLKQFWAILSSLGPIALVARDEFTRLVGAISGDDKLQQKTLGWRDFAQALEDVAHGFAHVLVFMEQFEASEGKDIEGLIHFGTAAKLFATGHFSDAKKEMNLGFAAENESAASAPTWASSGTTLDSYMKGNAPTPTSVLGGYLDSHDMAYRAALEVSKRTGISAPLIYGQMAFETNGFSHMAGRNNFSGLGRMINNKFKANDYASLEDYEAAYAKDLLDPRYLMQGIRSARTGEDFTRALTYPGHTYYDTTVPNAASAYAGGINRYAKEFSSSIGTINIYSSPNLTPEQHSAVVTKAVNSALDSHYREMITVTNGAYAQ